MEPSVPRTETPRELWLPRALALGVVAGVAGATGSARLVWAAAAVVVLVDALRSGARRTVAASAALIVLAAAAAGPLLAATSLRELGLAAGAAALIVLACRRPDWGLAALVVAAPFHTILLRALEGRWLVDAGSLGLWKEVLVTALVTRTAAMWIDRGAPRPTVAWAEPWVWLIGLLGVAAGVTIASLADGRVGVGLATRGLAADFGPLAVFAVAMACSAEHARIERAAAFVVGLATVLALFGFAQLLVLGPDWYSAMGYFGPRDFKVPGYEVYRLTSVFLDPIPAGLLSAIGAVLALDGLAGAATRTRAWVATSAFVVCAVAAASSFTRSAWLGLAVGVVLVARSAAGATVGRTRVRIALLAMVLAGLPLAPSLARWARDTLTRPPTETSLPLHWDAWRIGIERIGRHPLGLGPGRAGEVSVRMLGSDGLVTESSYLQFGVEYGVAGTVLLVGFVVSVALALRRAAHRGVPFASGTLGAWTALAIAGLFLHALTERAVAYPVVVLAGLVLGAGARSTIPAVPAARAG